MWASKARGCLAMMAIEEENKERKRERYRE